VALDSIVIKPEQLLFLEDKTAKDRSASRRRRFWSPRGSTPIALAKFKGSHGRRYSMLAACDINGFILESCHVVEQEGPAASTVDTAVFTEWINDCIIPVLGNYSMREECSIVVLDNASIHHTDEIVEMIQSTDAVIIYLPPYSPDLNPIKMMFHQYKDCLKRYHKEDWLLAHTAALCCVKPHQARNYHQENVWDVSSGEACLRCVGK
jgi:DDE superfamily endonuclease